MQRSSKVITKKNACGLLVIIKYFEKCPFVYGRFVIIVVFFKTWSFRFCSFQHFFWKSARLWMVVSANGHLVKRAFFKKTGIFWRNGEKKNLCLSLMGSGFSLFFYNFPFWDFQFFFTYSGIWPPPLRLSWQTAAKTVKISKLTRDP